MRKSFAEFLEIFCVFVKGYANVEITNAALLQSASKALFRWAKAGFSVVGETTLKNREDQCLACPHLKQPKKLLQKVVSSKEGDAIGRRVGASICELCGCSVSKKLRLPTESCPGTHPDDPALNRWGEPLLKK